MRNRDLRGFTLIELMIVVAIIGLLAALAIPNFVKFEAKARQSEAKVNLKALFTAQKAFYGDKQVYCTALDLVGFIPERNNRYAFFATATPGATDVRTTATDAISSGTVTGCGTLTGQTDAKLMEAIASDVFKWGNPVTTYTPTFIGGAITFSPNVGSPYTPPAVAAGIQGNPGTGGPTSCAYGQCEFSANAQANIDGDATNDEWVIASTGGTAVGVGNFVDGEPINTNNDVNL